MGSPTKRPISLEGNGRIRITMTSIPVAATTMTTTDLEVETPLIFAKY
jgi:hypothetical protein